MTSKQIYHNCTSNQLFFNKQGLHRLGFQNVAVGRINAVATLTGFSHKKMNGRLAGTKKVAVITRWP